MQGHGLDLRYLFKLASKDYNTFSKVIQSQRKYAVFSFEVTSKDSPERELGGSQRCATLGKENTKQEV